jgi:anthranilate phosphoribosyltransferase
MHEITALNAAGGLIVANIVDDFEQGLELSMQTIKSGKAYSHFVDFVKECGDVAKLEEIQL